MPPPSVKGPENGITGSVGWEGKTVSAILPVMVLFIILQREFISGLTAGAVKG